MSIKLGSTNIILPYSKAYLGNDLVYQKNGYEEINFMSCLFPISWTKVVEGTEYKSTDKYGEWHCGCDSYYSSSYYPINVFNRLTSTSWRPRNFSDDTTSHEVFIELPKGILIKPTLIYIVAKQLSLNSKVLGYNPSTDEWEELCTNTLSTGGTFSVITDKYYSKFKLEIYRYSATLNYSYVYTFEIIKRNT